MDAVDARNIQKTPSVTWLYPLISLDGAG